MNWVVVGLIAGVVAYLVDWLMWGKVFTKGMDAFVTPMTPEEMKRFMGPAMAKSAVLALIFGVLFAWFYGQFRPCLWVQNGGPLAGMEFAPGLWGATILLLTLGGSGWDTKVRPRLIATAWAGLARTDAARIVGG